MAETMAEEDPLSSASMGWLTTEHELVPREVKVCLDLLVL